MNEADKIGKFWDTIPEGDSGKDEAVPEGTSEYGDVTDSVSEEEEIRPPREGFAVFEPTPATDEVTRDEPSIEGEGDGLPEEWKALGREVFRSYGDSLAGVAGYMGPIGVLLATIGVVVILLRVGIDAAAQVIGGYVLMIATGSFIIGLYLLVFHLFHWLSNRNKGQALSTEIRHRLVFETCRHLDIRVDDGKMSLRCSYFDQGLSESPECVVCDHYSPSEPGTEDDEDKTVLSIKVESEGGSGIQELRPRQASDREREIPGLDEMEIPKIGGESGGDLDEAGDEANSGPDVEDQGKFAWDESKWDG